MHPVRSARHAPASVCARGLLAHRRGRATAPLPARAARGQRLRALCLLALVWIPTAVPTTSLAQQQAAEVLEMTPSDERRLEGQRSWVESFSRRYMAPVPRGDLRMLESLQRLLDADAIRAAQTEELQSLGVVLGDVMAKQLGLEWVVYLDRSARSKALRLPGGRKLYFPVTMIAKRVEMGVPFTVRALYESIAAEVAEEKAPRSFFPNRTPRRELPPRPSADDPVDDSVDESVDKDGSGDE